MIPSTSILALLAVPIHDVEAPWLLEPQSVVHLCLDMYSECGMYSAGSVLAPTAATRLCRCTGSVVACTAGTPLRQGGGASGVPAPAERLLSLPTQCCRLSTLSNEAAVLL
jgi:hypothetical protein